MPQQKFCNRRKKVSSTEEKKVSVTETESLWNDTNRKTLKVAEQNTL